MDAEKMEFLGQDEFIQEISMKAAETADSFIFETVLPFCQENYKGELKKEDLSRALCLLKAQEPVKPKREVNENGQILSCGNCGAWFAVQKQKYCHECGQAVKWDG